MTYLFCKIFSDGETYALCCLWPLLAYFMSTSFWTYSPSPLISGEGWNMKPLYLSGELKLLNTLTFRCDIPVVFCELNTKYITSSRNTTKFYCTVCGNKMPTRCNRGFYCRSYCLLNMFRAPLCPSSGAQEYYTVAAACGISCCGFQVAGLVWSW